MADRELSIKIKIADREYPMKVTMEQEQLLRRTGKLINDKIKTFRDTFGIDDKQDLLAMVAFDIMAEQLKKSGKNEAEDHELNTEIDQLNSLLRSSLSSNR